MLEGDVSFCAQTERVLRQPRRILTCCNLEWTEMKLVFSAETQFGLRKPGRVRVVPNAVTFSHLHLLQR